MGSVSQVYRKQYRSGNVTTDWTLLGTSNGIVAGYMSGNNHVAVFRFELPKNVKQLTFSACIYDANTSSNPSIRYKVVSGAEDASLANANVNTAADGTFTVDSVGDFVRFSFTIDKFVPKGTTYLYLWTNKASGTSNSLGIRGYPVSNQYGTRVSYVEGGAVIYLDDGVSVSAYEIHIDNGTSWDQYEADMDSGTGWDVCG